MLRGAAAELRVAGLPAAEPGAIHRLSEPAGQGGARGGQRAERAQPLARHQPGKWGSTAQRPAGLAAWGRAAWERHGHMHWFAFTVIIQQTRVSGAGSMDGEICDRLMTGFLAGRRTYWRSSRTRALTCGRAPLPACWARVGGQRVCALRINSTKLGGLPPHAPAAPGRLSRTLLAPHRSLLCRRRRLQVIASLLQASFGGQSRQRRHGAHVMPLS